MDVCETSDNVLVVHHDKSLLRTCGVNKSIQEVKYS
jgi:glycerophosphoryl diester phosphodiesterase